MKLRLVIILLGTIVSFASADGQDNFRFLNQLGDTIHIEIKQESVGNHYLGEYIAIKFYRIKEVYTYEEMGTVTNPVAQTIVNKPAIYYSLKKLNTHYKRQLKKGEIDTSVAMEELGRCFDVGFAIFEQDTSEFEKALKSARKPDQIADLFTQVILE
jgi:hypothetical protein